MKGITQGVAGSQVGGAGNATRKHQRGVVVEREALVVDVAVAGQVHLVRRGNLAGAGNRDHVARDARTEQQVDHGKALDLLQTVRKEHRHAAVACLLEHRSPLPARIAGTSLMDSMIGDARASGMPYDNEHVFYMYQDNALPGREGHCGRRHVPGSYRISRPVRKRSIMS